MLRSSVHPWGPRGAHGVGCEIKARSHVPIFCAPKTKYWICYHNTPSNGHATGPTESGAIAHGCRT